MAPEVVFHPYHFIINHFPCIHPNERYGNRSIAWIRSVANKGTPFFCYVGTTGPHLGVVPAPWHRLQVRELTNL